MYWKQLAAKAKDLPPIDHPWAVLIESTIMADLPELYQELLGSGELEPFVQLKTADAIAEYERLVKDGTAADIAQELAVDSIMPKQAENPAEDYEIEGGQEDQAAALEQYLGKG